MDNNEWWLLESVMFLLTSACLQMWNHWDEEYYTNGHGYWRRCYILNQYAIDRGIPSIFD